MKKKSKAAAEFSGDFTLILSGRPKPSKNSRVKPKNLPFMVTNKAASNWMDAAAVEAKKQMDALDLKPIEAPLGIIMTIRVCNRQHLGDADNMEVAVNDALKKVVWADDRPSVLPVTFREVIVDGTLSVRDEYVTVRVVAAERLRPLVLGGEPRDS